MHLLNLFAALLIYCWGVRVDRGDLNIRVIKGVQTFQTSNIHHSNSESREGGGILLTNCQHQHLYCTHRKVNRMLITPYSVHVYK